MSRRLHYFTAIGLAALGFLGGAILFQVESAVLSYGGTESATLQDGILNGAVRLGYSAYADQRLLAACFTGMTGVRQMVNSEENNTRFATRCQALAAEMIERLPLSSFAWCVSAQANALLGDFAGMNRDLRKSWELGKFEGWIAQNRNLIAEANFDRLDAETKIGNDADLAIMATGQTGIAPIARLYRDNSEFRERMGRIVSGLHAQDQERFVYELERELKVK